LLILLLFVSSYKSLLHNSHSRLTNSSSCFNLANLRLLAFQAVAVSEAWKNNGLGSGSAFYGYLHNYDSFSCFSGYSRIHYSA